MSKVTLVDGREVDSASPEWRHECEARLIAALPTLDKRRAWLDGLVAKRGEAEVQRLRETVAAIWNKEHRGHGKR